MAKNMALESMLWRVEKYIGETGFKENLNPISKPTFHPESSSFKPYLIFSYFFTPLK
jgi:hypothetical protein